MLPEDILFFSDCAGVAASADVVPVAAELQKQSSGLKESHK